MELQNKFAELNSIFSTNTATIGKNIQRYQETVDRFDHKYECAIRKGEDYDEKIKIAQSKILMCRKAVAVTGDIKPTDAKVVKKIEDLERSLSSTKALLGKMCNETDQLRSKIQIMRRTNMKIETKAEKLELQITRSKSAAKSYLSTTSNNFTVIKNSSSTISKLNNTYRLDSHNLTNRESKLATNLQGLSKTMSPKKVKRPRTPHHEYSDYLNINRFLAKRWARDVKEKHEQIAKYDLHISELMRALKAIGSSISQYDITDVTEMNLSNYEQELSLKNQLLLLIEENEKFESDLRVINQKAATLRIRASEYDSKTENLVAKKKLELENLKLEVLSKKSEKAEIENECKYYFSIVNIITKTLENQVKFPITQKNKILNLTIDFSNHDEFTSKLEEIIKITLGAQSIMNGKKISEVVESNKIDISDLSSKILEAESRIFTQEFDELIEPLSLSHFRHRARKHLT